MTEITKEQKAWIALQDYLESMSVSDDGIRYVMDGVADLVADIFNEENIDLYEEA